MKGSMLKLCSIALGASLLAGCASNEVTQEAYSGFLTEGQYAQVNKLELEDGDTVYRWVNPTFNRQNYPALIVESVGFYPEPQLGSGIEQQDLDQISGYLTQALKEQLAGTVQLTDQAGPGVARLRAAITGVEIKNEGMKAYEVVPIAAVFAAAQVATDSRDKVTEVYLESKVQNSETGEDLVIALRKIRGSNVDEAQNQLALENIQQALDEVAVDAVNAIKGKDLNAAQ